MLKHTLRRGLKVGEFVDLVSEPQDREVRATMLGYGLVRLRTDGCVFAQNWAIRESLLEKEMMAAGLTRRRKKMSFLLSPGATRPEWYDPNAWYLAPGDGNDI